MTEHGNAELIAALRRDAGDYGRHMQALPECADCEILSWDQREVRAWEAATALVAADQRAAELAGVVEKAVGLDLDRDKPLYRAWPDLWDKARRILTSASDRNAVLREHDAKVRAETLRDAATWVEDLAVHDGLMYRQFDDGEEVAESIPTALRVRADRIEQGKEQGS